MRTAYHDLTDTGMTRTETIMVKVTNGVALGGLASPAWLPSLESVSQFAGLMVPLLSAAWLLYQIGRTIIRDIKRKSDAENGS